MTTRTAAPWSRSVGPPGGLRTASVPSKAASRRSMPRRPVPPAGSAPPRRRRRPRCRSTPSCVAQVDPAPGSRRVLGHVGQRLGDREVRGRLHRRGRPAGQVDVDLDRDRAGQRQRPGPRRRGRGRRAPAGGCRGPGRAARSSACPADSRASAQQLAAWSGSRSSSCSASPRFMPQGDQPGLRAVVQVPLDPAQLGGLRVDGLRPGLGQRADPSAPGTTRAPAGARPGAPEACAAAGRPPTRSP